MEIRAWTYEDFPEFTEFPESAGKIKTTGDEMWIAYINDVEYANMDGVPLHLQILRPVTRNEPEKVLPCVVFVQGSAWMKQNVYMNVPQLADLARKGYVVVCVEYRHSEIAAFPAQIKDARNAVRFMKCHAAEYHIDPEKVVIAGDSSGGHTAVFVGLIHDDDSTDNLFPGISGDVKGIIDYYGAVSALHEDDYPTTVNHHLPDSPEGMLMGGANLRERKDLCEKMSAKCCVIPETAITPILIFHGTKDRTVNARQSVELYQKLKECQKDVQLYLLEGADHGGAEFWTAEVIGIVDEFIRKCIGEVETHS